MKFCLKINKNACEMLIWSKIAYGEHAIMKCFKWYWQVKEGSDVHADTRSGWPKMQRADPNVDSVWNLVHSDQRLSVRLIAEELNLNRENNSTDSNRRFWKVKNFLHDDALNLDQWVETVSFSSDPLKMLRCLTRSLPVMKHCFQYDL